ncbi:MAG: sugar phosphate nucleotidyltransferase [Candidatus Pacearchaeota archaeon]|jgi:glucose-1-phosphate thymidylyltransferase
MKGIILAGGKGTRLWPLTQVTNKHLVSVGKIPMIEYPLYTMKNLRVDSISVVTGGEHFKEIAGYLGKLHPEMEFSYHYQSKPGGIAQALSLTEKFVSDSKLAVILGDNIFNENFYEAAKEFEKSKLGAMLFLKKVEDPERFGVAEIKGNKIISIEEKPDEPKSDLAVIGLYFYDSSVFERIKKLRPSKRGEYEITDVNNSYIKEGSAGFCIVNGFWSDAGTHESRQRCEKFVRKNLEKKIFSLLE